MSATPTIRHGLVGAAIVAVLSIAAIGNGALAMPAAASVSPTEGCAWKRHSRQVVKRVRRHGQQRRLRRTKHWWTCEETQQSAFSPQPALPTSPSPETPSPEEPEPQVRHLGVKAVEYSYTLSRPEVAAGEVIVELNNQGEDPHNLVLEHEGTEDPALEIPSTPSIAQASASFTLSPGTYRLYCSLYKHEAKGMEATLLVAGG